MTNTVTALMNFVASVSPSISKQKKPVDFSTGFLEYRNNVFLSLSGTSYYAYADPSYACAAMMRLYLSVN